MKRKNLEKAIIMGLVAASISVPVWADTIDGNIWNGNINQGSTDGSLIINTPIIPEDPEDPDGPKKAIDGIGFNGTVDIGTGILNVTATGNGISAGWVNNATVNIFAGDITIKSGQNGIFTTWGDDIFGGNNTTKWEVLSAALAGKPVYVEKGAGITGTVNIGTQERPVGDVTITADGQGIDNKKGTVNIYGSDNSKVYIHSTGTSGIKENQAGIASGDILTKYGATIIVNGDTTVRGKDVEVVADGGDGINTAAKDSSTTINAINSVQITSDNVVKDEQGNVVEKDIENAGINNIAGTTTITANNAGIEITSSKYGIVAQDGVVNLTSYTGNKVNAAIENITLTNEDGEKVTQSYGRKHSIKAEGGSDVDIIATGGDNKLYGVVYAKGDVKTDYMDTTKVTINHGSGSGSNRIYSSAHGSAEEGRENVVAALYAQNKGKIEVIAGNGGINHIETYYANLDETNDDSERTVWAQRGGIIEIKGTTIIKSSNAEHFYTTGGYANNSRGVAITAGSGEIVADIPDGVRSTVNLEYGPEVKIDGKTFSSAIYGDIVAGCGGLINIKKAINDGQYGIDIQGNVLAANGGELTVDLGQGGTWYGRADDYQDADGGKLSFYNPVFSNQIESSGTVNIIMGEGSKWCLTGQSWVSSLNVTQGKGNVTIDMARFNKGTHSLTISELIGIADDSVDATFVMDLDHINHDTSDMLYIKNATGEYDVVLNDVIDGMDQISEGNVLRFATVQGGASFNSVTLKDAGLYNLGFEVDHSEYDTAAVDENKGYNDSGSNEEGDYETVGTNKPGNDNVEGFFDLNKDSEDNTQKIMLMDTTDAADDPNSVQNWYITKVTGQDLSDGGKTVVNMSKVNYSNAVYMDRLNKRLGEARYINNEEDQGMWVRMRHDRIGKDNEFRIMNTMYELGYDEKQECDNGERRVGAAIDYMDGSSEYTGVGGSGDVSRKGIWLYDTWLGDKGHYSDFVAKWGHLSNDFTLYRGGDKITGDFSNNVYSISAEYGRKKDIGNNWYFEPQVQLQYARVTDANYTTSQGTEVSLDAINSLIARAGFRLGKDLGERSTVYFKADVLHEFLGDQDIYATDGTGTMDVTYGNEGTWCDIGFGFATAMSKTSYAYLDVETSLGNDYEETYQINAGLQWSF